MGWSGYLTVDGVEVINVARTEGYANLDRAPWFVPTYKNQALGMLLGQPIYQAPDVDDAPWYDPDRPESAGFWGVYPLDVQGLDNSSRSSTVVEFTTDGGSPGRLRHSTKTFVYNTVLVGASEQAVKYGMDWLRRATLGAACSTSLADTTTLGVKMGLLSARPVLPFDMPPTHGLDASIEFLEGGTAHGVPADFLDGGLAFAADGSATEPEAALRTWQRSFRNVKVVDGPTVSRTRNMAGPCGGTAWVVTFTIVAGDPYEYGADQPVLQGYLDPDVSDPWAPSVVEEGVAGTSWSTFTEVDCGVDIWQPIYDPECGALSAPPGPPSIPLGCYSPPATWRRRKVSLPAANIPLWGDMMPVVTVYAADVMRNLRIRWYADPEGTFDPGDSPCDFIGDWVVSYIPAGGTMVIDAVARQTRVTTSLGHVRRADSLVFQNDSTPILWPRLTCGFGYIMTLDLPTGEPVPVVDLTLVPRAAA